MSFKYRFILSFVLLEIFFIILIVTVNFQAISNSSEKLISKQIESNISFMKQLLKVPMSIYDIATLDNMVENSVNLGHINSLVILDSKERILSQAYNYNLESLEVVLKTRSDSSVIKDDKSFELRYVELFEEETYIGSFYLIFDTSENSAFIQSNQERTFFIIIIEIIISTLLSYIIGSKLTKMLTRLSELTQKIGENKIIEIPYLDKKDEIGILSNSLNTMQYALKERNNKLKELAVTLKNQKNDLIIANKSKDDFLANMSHELKTPLNSINVISSVMMKNKNKSLNEEQVKNLSIINSCGNDLLMLINDVLDLSKLEAGEIELHCETIDFKKLIKDVELMFEPLMMQKSLKFDVYYDESIQYIYTDLQRVKQIVKNLLSNAVKFTSEGTIVLKVEQHQDDIKVSVKDDGIGIAKEKLEHIFDRFKQADSSTTRKFGGTGLGLSICKELANLLKGSLTVSSILNEGSTFVLTIPKNEHRIEKVETPNNEVQSSANEVIVLNNNPVEMMNFIIALTQDFTVMQVSTFDDLLLKTKTKKFDYVIVDLSSCSQKEIELFPQYNLPFVFMFDGTLEVILQKVALNSFDKSMELQSIIKELKA